MAKKSAAVEIDLNEDHNTKERIAQAAVKLFASKGYDGTSTKEICDAAKVNIAAIHYHYGSKEKLYCDLIAGFGGSRLQSVERILDSVDSKEELKVRLKMFISEYFEVFVQQPELCRIVQAEIELMPARSEEVFRSTFLKTCTTLINFLAVAKEKGFIDKSIDPQIAARCLFSQLAHQTKCDKINLKFYGLSLHQEEYRAKWVEHILKIFLEGAMAD